MDVYAARVPVVCVRLSDQAVAALDAKSGGDRSGWLRGVVHRALGLEKGADGVEVIPPAPEQTVEVLRPGDTVTVVDGDLSIPTPRGLSNAR